MNKKKTGETNKRNNRSQSPSDGVVVGHVNMTSLTDSDGAEAS